MDPLFRDKTPLFPGRKMSRAVRSKYLQGDGRDEDPGQAGENVDAGLSEPSADRLGHSQGENVISTTIAISALRISGMSGMREFSGKTQPGIHTARWCPMSDFRERKTLENAALACPVHHSLL
jgi:hypothetical protein